MKGRPTQTFLLLSVCALALAGQAAADPGGASLSALVFPPNCTCDRNATDSPFRLQLSNISVPAQTPSSLNMYCFKLQKVGCNSTSTCCTSAGVNKLEFDVVQSSDCKKALKRVTINGVKYGAWSYNLNDAVLRITSLNYTITSSDLEVCIFLQQNSNCSTTTSLCKEGAIGCKYALFNIERNCCPVSVIDNVNNPPFAPAVGAPPPPASRTRPPSPTLVPIANFPPPSPSPPPPPPPSPPPPSPPPPPPPSPPPPSPPPPPPIFPNCTCTREQSASRLVLDSTVITTTLPSGISEICFTVYTKADCDSKSDCCTFTLHKLELMSKASCAGSLMGAWVNGVRTTRTFQTNPYPALKVTNLNGTFDTVNGLRVCIHLRPPCNTIATLSDNTDGTIAAGLFNAPGPDTNCCPTYILR